MLKGGIGAKADTDIWTNSRPDGYGKKLAPQNQIREEENLHCIGGLRNPNMAVAKSPPLICTGTRIRGVLESVMRNPKYCQVVVAAVDSIGAADSSGMPETLVASVRRKLCREFKVSVDQNLGMGRSEYVSNLWQAILADAQDPETEVHRWMRYGTPTGIGESVIRACGVFPKITAASSAVENSKVYAKLAEGRLWSQAAHKNYSSFYEQDGKLAAEEISRIQSCKFIEVLSSWTEVITRWPRAVASKIALLIKARQDGSLKLRFIMDLLRSGVNGGAIVPERVVLPRILDYTHSIVDLLEYDWASGSREVAQMEVSQRQQADCQVELVTLDFADAFYTLWLQDSERGSMIFKTLSGWAVFQRVCFGMAAAPLLWGRVAAAACRIGQATFLPNELRIQCYVDDPAIAVRGDRLQRKKLVGMLLLLWLALGFRMSWAKGCMGSQVPWIGTTLSLDWRTPVGKQVSFPGVCVQLQQNKFEELRNNVEDAFSAKGMIPIKQVHRIAGQLSWVSGIIPWARSFNSCLWAAITAHAAEIKDTNTKSAVLAKDRPTHLFFAKRIKPALGWIRLLLAGQVRDQDGKSLVLARWISVAHRLPGLTFCLRTDASPFGMGAVLFRNGVPLEWLAVDWSQEDLRLFGAKVGDPAWQAEWEILAILIALDTWLARLRGEAACLIQSDALAALYTARKLAGRSPAMNFVAAEIALRVESAHILLDAEHVKGILNFECDALSRLGQGEAIPKRLQSVVRVNPKPRNEAFFWSVPRAGS